MPTAAAACRWRKPGPNEMRIRASRGQGPADPRSAPASVAGLTRSVSRVALRWLQRRSTARAALADEPADRRPSQGEPAPPVAAQPRHLRLTWHGAQLSLQVCAHEGRLRLSLSLPLRLPVAAGMPSPRRSESPELPLIRPPVPARALLERCSLNPILQPRAHIEWEALAVFNTAAIAIDGRVHLIYRAIGWDGTSVFGHASTRDGVHIDEQSDEPVYTDESTLAGYAATAATCIGDYRSGPSHYGCEDPRLTRVDERIYMTYTAFDGAHPPGVALTSIAVADFTAGRWNWRPPVLISPLHQAHKNWVIFPRRIGGRLALLHGISPEVQIEYLDSLDLHAESPIESHFAPSGDPRRWDNRIRGVGPPPLETPAGWLLIYHAMDQRDPGRYKLGAMLLDLDDPTRILARLPYPLLEPDARYENEGFKQGVIYACGAALAGDRLQVFYGGADTVVCVASVPLSRLLAELRRPPAAGSERMLAARPRSGGPHADAAAKPA